MSASRYTTIHQPAIRLLNTFIYWIVDLLCQIWKSDDERGLCGVEAGEV